MNRTLIVANWKMHLNTSQASLLLHRLQERIKIYRDIEVVLAPSMLVLQPLSVQLDRRKFRLAAQNIFDHDEGAYTGEVSATMLRELVHYAIVGHSERRHVFNEQDAEIGRKVAACVRNEIMPILCVGETKHERLAGETNRVLHDQLSAGLRHVTSQELGNVVVAYEPVWAIGTGEFAKPDQVVAAVKTIKHNLAQLYGPRVAERVRILYGGSVTPDIAGAYLNLESVDGLLVGGASLNYHQFSAIVKKAYQLNRANGDE